MSLYYISCVWTHVSFFCLLGREGRRERGRRGPRGRGGQGGSKGQGQGRGGREGGAQGGKSSALSLVCLLGPNFLPIYIETFLHG